jgi:hypothetical protein
MADMHREEGWQVGHREGTVVALRNTLINLLREKFGKVPRAVERTIAATDDVARLDAWLRRLVRVDTIDDVGITTGR